MESIPLWGLGASLPNDDTPCLFEFRSKRVKSKLRELAVPNRAMRALHAEIIDRLTPHVAERHVLLYAYGAVAGRSAIGNAAEHAGNQYFYQLDIADAYGSVDLFRLAQILHEEIDRYLGEVGEISEFLHSFCAGKTGGLAQGGPASPLLFNIYCAVEIDRYIRDLFLGGFTVYTRYLDDITISSPRKLPSIFRRRIRDVVHDAGFEVNRRKSKVLDLDLSPVTVTGVMITQNGRLRPAERDVKRLLELLKVPASEMDAKMAAEFAGLSGYIRSFGRKERWLKGVRISPEIYSLEKRCRKKLSELRLAKVRIARTSSLRTSPRFDRLFIDLVKSKAFIEEVVGSYLSLSKAGRDFVTLCPFHKERTPSFKVSPHKGIYHCFGCGKTGDAIRFVMEMERISFHNAVELLAEKVGLLDE